jgi:DNA primase large subunit
MTTRSDLSPVTRETSAFVREKGLRALIVTVRGSFIELRPKGMKKFETVDLTAAYQQAVKARVFQAKRERDAKRKAKKGTRR